MDLITLDPGLVGGAPPESEKPTPHLILGDEAVALAALHAGIRGAYAYPGTPSTEIFEYLVRHGSEHGAVAHWAANEKTAYEQALGVSMAGGRALVSMKHVGLNVAADPFVNSALVRIHGGLVVVVADDPGMHSSQNEQDSRVLADFAKIPCLEPSTQQEAYDMTRAAFAWSERFHVPVLVRLVTRLCHGRAEIVTRPPDPAAEASKVEETTAWTLLPGNARRLWTELLETHADVRSYAEASPWNQLMWGDEDAELGVITTGVARNYFEEVMDEVRVRPHRLHVGAYPLPLGLLRALASTVDRILVLEEGFPFLEERIRGVLDHRWTILGKASGEIPMAGEMTPEKVRHALGLPHRPMVRSPLHLPMRPPQLCQGCPHRDTYTALNRALEGEGDALVAGDIGCYTLGALEPYNAIDSCVCMGASIGMAKGAADAGLKPAVAVIGDSTFLHSGITPLLDAVAHDTDMTVLILDNGTVAMTGQQPSVIPQSRLEPIILGVGVAPEHLKVVEVHPKKVDELAQLIRDEIDHPGLSVVVARRPCIEAVRKEKSAARKKKATPAHGGGTGASSSDGAPGGGADA